MKIEVGQKVIITTDNWFYGPDGKEYRGAYGTVVAVSSDELSLGIKTNRNATNWYVQLGGMVIAGCQIHYVVRCDKAPPMTVENWTMHEGRVISPS